MNEIFLDDLRERVQRGLSGQAHKGYWCGGKAYGFRLKPILDSSQRDAYGQAARIGTRLEIDPEQAKVVREIFQRGRCELRTYCRRLNARNVEVNFREPVSADRMWTLRMQ